MGSRTPGLVDVLFLPHTILCDTSNSTSAESDIPLFFSRVRTYPGRREPIPCFLKESMNQIDLREQRRGSIQTFRLHFVTVTARTESSENA